MDHAAILERVIALTSEELECDDTGMGEGTEFKSLGADSIDLLELVTAIEDEFGITLDDERLQAIASIGDAVRAIEVAQASRA